MSSFFINFWIWPAAAAVLLPPIIEWLFRRRKRRTELPTIRFLLDSRQQKKVRRQDRLLLILRMLAILLLVSAISRPLLQRGLTGDDHRNVIVLLDGTASMNQQVDVTTSFRLAQKKAAAVVRALPDGTTVSVVYLGHNVSVPVEKTTDLRTAAARIEKLQAGSGAAPVSAALMYVKDFIQQHDINAAELYVFSDFQKYTWQRQGAEAVETSRALNALADVSETFLVDVGGQAEFNYLATLLRPVENVLSAGKPVIFQAMFETRGQPPADARATVTFLVDGGKKDVREIDASAESATLEFAFNFPDAGEYLVEAVIDGDGHRADNDRMYLCSVPKNIEVLILDETSEQPEPKSLFLSRAIRPPGHAALEKLSHFDVKTIGPDRVAYENLAEYAVVILTATSQLNDALVGQLEAYAANGGAVWFFMGDAVNLFDYNSRLFKNGQGLLPCRLEAKESLAVDATPAVYLNYGDSSHPGLAQFARFSDSQNAVLRQYVKLAAVEQTDTAIRVVAALSDKTPAIVEKRFGRGLTLLCNTTPGPEWTYMSGLSDYPILIQELLRYLLGNPDTEVNLNIGDRFQQPVFVSTQHLSLKLPDGNKVRLTPRKQNKDDELPTISFDDTTQQGLYQIEAIEEVAPRRRFVVNQSEEEGDLARLTADEFDDAFAVRGLTWIGPQRTVEDLAANLHTITEVAPWLLCVLLGSLSLETLLAWRFGRRREEVAA
ncbi:MAG: BatA and WFA domain-containing protein [Planctomycetota bacterium]|nr:BatA and WFA domain-containing protein [Planctomycetota bacterium]